MLKKPTLEIEAQVLAEYDKDYIKFCTDLYEDIERNNPGMAEIFSLFLQSANEKNREIILGLQMASVVYRQLERSSDESLPIVEMRPSLRKVGLEALGDAQGFVNKYGTSYFQNGLLGTKTISSFVGDALAHGVG